MKIGKKNYGIWFRDAKDGSQTFENIPIEEVDLDKDMLDLEIGSLYRDQWIEVTIDSQDETFERTTTVSKFLRRRIRYHNLTLPKENSQTGYGFTRSSRILVYTSEMHLNCG